jgi:DsbC/DsbD-like thiol-disulfide interchange protein
MRSIGYENEVTIPLELTPSQDGTISLNARLHFGVCRDVCVPAVVDLQQALTPDMNNADANIQTALAATPVSATEADIAPANCSIETTANGPRIHVNVAAEMSGTNPAMIVEYSDQDVWIGTTKLKQNAANWQGITPYYDGRTTPQDISFENVRITLLTTDTALDIRGCSAD